MPKYYSQFKQLSLDYEDITSHVPAYVPALINKFCALGMMLYGKSKQNTGFKLLKKAEDYFDSQVDPMMSLLGVTVRIEKISAWHDFNPSFDLDFNGEIQKIVDDLSVQTNLISAAVRSLHS